MVISYDKLWKILANRKITKKVLCARAGISSSTMHNMTMGQNVSLDVLARICTAPFLSFS